MLRTIQSADRAVETIELVKSGIQGLDIEQLKSILNLANQLLPGYFPEGAGDLVELMRRFQATLLISESCFNTRYTCFPTPARKRSANFRACGSSYRIDSTLGTCNC